MNVGATIHRIPTLDGTGYRYRWMLTDSAGTPVAYGGWHDTESQAEAALDLFLDAINWRRA